MARNCQPGESGSSTSRQVTVVTEDGADITSISSRGQITSRASGNFFQGQSNGIGGAFFSIDFTVSRATLYTLDVTLTAASNDSTPGEARADFNGQELTVRSGENGSASISRQGLIPAGSGFGFRVSAEATAQVGHTGGVAPSSAANWDVTITFSTCDASSPSEADAASPDQEGPAASHLDVASLSFALGSEPGEAPATEPATTEEGCLFPTVGFKEAIVGGDGTITEDGRLASLPVELSAPQERAVKIGFGAVRIVGHEAVPSDDFENVNLGQLVFAPGETAKSIEIALVDDGDAEPDEAFGVRLFVISGPAIPAHVDERAQVIVRDDDCAMNMPSAAQENNAQVPDNVTGTVCGSIHRDEIFGNNIFRPNLVGNVILGGAGDDLLLGGSFNDILAGGAGVDQVFGDQGNDELYASYPSSPGMVARTSLYVTEIAHGDKLFGGPGDDTLIGSSGVDHLLGGIGDDSLFGHGDADILEGQEGGDRLYEGSPFSNDSQLDIIDGGRGPIVANVDLGIDVCFSSLVADEEVGCEI